jgi:AcrR family transcriptional regulator
MTGLKGSDDGRGPDARRRQRREKMLDAAEALFLELGFGRATLSAVVSRSGGSLATLYDEFGNKQSLLHAVVARMRDEGLKDLNEAEGNGASPRQVLGDLAVRFHTFAMAPRTLAFMRIVIAYSLENPEFGREFDRDMRVHILERVAAKLDAWSDAGQARVDDSTAAAELYFASIMCNAPIKAMMGVAPEATDRAVLDQRLEPFLQHFRIA